MMIDGRIRGLRRRKTESEDFLIDKINKGKTPQHVAIIMDGNGRWASKRGLPRLAGHKAGVTAIRDCVEISPRIGVDFLTLYTFSVENWKRPADEVSGLMKLFEEMLQKEMDELHRQNVKIRVIGRFNELPDSTKNKFLEAIDLTSNNTGLNLIIALNYGGRTEIVDSVNKLISEKAAKEPIDEEDIRANLYLSDVPDPDLVIRTSGEVRISNFLLWQIAYSEIWITDILWPDFRKKDMLSAVADFQQRKRRFGGTVEDKGS